MPGVKKFTITPLQFDAKLVDAMRARNNESVSNMAKKLKVGIGRAAMAELIASTERVTIDDPAKLARAVARDRKAGRSWGWLAARYGITETSCRRAYEAATGQPFSSIDYRKAVA
ncbi:MAG TPA: hypothetical protein VHY83_15145 [Solirubrobacteraceae bacterium]|jgi:predicted transcriptional regulator|nr:hypothetical protein [Solirubrobacteraceae bacterium]